MESKDIIEILRVNGILVEEIGLQGNSYSYILTFDRKYSDNIDRNIQIYDVEFFLTSAKNRALMESRITNFISEPYVQQYSAEPYSFKINAPLQIVVYFAERIVSI